jgi:hypothetical protein
MSLDYAHHNLQTKRVSVRESGQEGGARRVTINADWVIMRDARPNVSAAGWKRSRTASASGGAKRSVHADIRGQLIAYEGGSCHAPSNPGSSRVITYNPNRFEPGSVPVFHYQDNGEEWTGSSALLITGGYAYELNK